jgi:hypothetical protein
MIVFIGSFLVVSAVLFNAWLEKRDLNILSFALTAFCFYVLYLGVTK